MSHEVTFMFPDQQLYRDRSTSQGQVGVVDSGGIPPGGLPLGSPGPILSPFGLEP